MILNHNRRMPVRTDPLPYDFDPPKEEPQAMPERPDPDQQPDRAAESYKIRDRTDANETYLLRYYEGQIIDAIRLDDADEIAYCQRNPDTMPDAFNNAEPMVGHFELIELNRAPWAEPTAVYPVRCPHCGESLEDTELVATCEVQYLYGLKHGMYYDPEPVATLSMSCRQCGADLPPDVLQALGVPDSDRPVTPCESTPTEAPSDSNPSATPCSAPTWHG